MSKTELTIALLGFTLTAIFFSVAQPLSAGTPLPEFKKTAQQPSDLEEKVKAIFEGSCAFFGCHAGTDPPKGLNLTEDLFYSSVVDVPSAERPELKRVKPGDPANSYLVMKIKGAPGIEGKRMPFDAAPLSEETIATIEKWIEQLSKMEKSPKRAPGPRFTDPFDGWKIVNLPTTQTLDSGLLLLLIGHRFNPRIDTGFETLFGIDGSAIMFLNLGYAVSDNLLVNLGRSNASDDVELSAKYRLARQSLQGGLPFALAFQGSVNWISEKKAGKSRLRGEALMFSGQVILSRELQPGLAINVVPGILLNPDIDLDGEDPLITVGLGGRWRFFKKFSLIGEWVPVVSGFTPTRTFGNLNRFDSWGGGIEAKVGGHVFQVFVTNSAGVTTDQYLRGGDLDIENVDLRFGFNIFRVLKF